MANIVESLRDKYESAARLFFSQLSQIKHYLDDPAIQEIMINRPGSVWIESAGKMSRVDISIDDVMVRGALKALATANSRDVSAVFDARTTGFRIAAALTPVAIKGNAICIRKHSHSLRTLDMYINDGAFDYSNRNAAEDRADGMVRGFSVEEIEAARRGGEGLASFFRNAVRRRKNIIIAGSTGSGKTTFINALISEIPDDERILTIEDTAELIIRHENSVSLETAEVRNGDKVELIDVRRLVKLALRFRPDRIIVGEIRGGEAYDMLDAMNTGHSGGICSLHADNAKMAMYRLESLVRMHKDAVSLPHDAMRKQIASTIDIVVFCSRSNGIRRPEQVAIVNGVNQHGEYELIFVT